MGLRTWLAAKLDPVMAREASFYAGWCNAAAQDDWHPGRVAGLIEEITRLQDEARACDKSADIAWRMVGRREREIEQQSEKLREAERLLNMKPDEPGFHEAFMAWWGVRCDTVV